MLERRKHYLQIALNSTLGEAREIILSLPPSERILIEAGTPLIKTYGIQAIRELYSLWFWRLKGLNVFPYIVADLKCMDRGESEVQIAKDGGASAAVVLGQAPIETINSFVGACASSGLDSMVDMMNIDQPIKILRRLRKPPTVVVLHRGVDEERFSKDKPIPYIQINKVRSSYNVMIAIAGGDTIREVERAIFNDADIVVVWKEFYKPGAATGQLAQDFLKKIR